jgi:hypothetical protein
VVADYSEGGEVVGGYGAAAVVGEALVALWVLLACGGEGREGESYLNVVVPVCLHVCVVVVVV